VVVTLALGLLAPVLAESGPSLTVLQAGIGGAARQHFWAPVTVRVDGGSSGFEGHVQVYPMQRVGRTWDQVAGAIYRHRVQVAAGGSKQVTVYFRYSRHVSGVGIALLEEGKRLVDTESSIRWTDPDKPVVCTLTPRDRILLSSMVNTGTYPSRVPVILDFSSYEDALPDAWMGYDAADAIILYSLDLENLSTPQRQALRNWVIAGGHLIFCFSGNAGMYQSAAPREWLPVTVSGTRELKGFGDLSKLPGLQAGDPLDEHGGVVARATPKPGSTVLYTQSTPEGDVPLVVTAPEGYGRKTFVAMDLGNRPFRGWAGLGRLSRVLISMVERPSNAVGDDNALQRHVGNLSGRGFRLPSFWIIGLFLAIYILLISPVNYLILRRLGRKEWSMITIPALVAIFSLGAYAVARSLHGGDLWLTRFAFIQMQGGQDTGVATTIVHIQSPANRTYRVTSSRPGAWSALQRSYQLPDQSAVFDQTPPGSVEELNIGMWARRFVRFDRLYAGGGLTCELARSGSRLIGRITNNSAMTLETVMVWMDDLRGCVVAHHLQPAQTRRFSTVFDTRQDLRSAFRRVASYYPDNRWTGSSHVAAVPGLVLTGSKGDKSRRGSGQKGLVLARIREIPWDVKIDRYSPKSQDQGILIVKVAANLQGESKRFRLVPGEIVTTREANVSGNVVHMYSSKAAVEFSFKLPPKLRRKSIKALRLPLMDVSGSRSAAQYRRLTIQGFRWKDRRWVKWPVGDGTATAPDALPFISETEQHVNVQITGNGQIASEPVLEYETEAERGTMNDER